MGELNPDIVDYIDSIEITTKKESKYIKDNDWTLIELASQREEEFNLHNLLVSRAITHAESLHKIAKEDVENPIVKKMFTALLESFHLHIDRSQNYISSSDWSNYLEKGLSRSDMKSELTFQSDIMKLITELKNKVRKLNIFNEGKSIDVRFHSDGIASLIMYNEVMINRYPEIQDYIDKRRNS